MCSPHVVVESCVCYFVFLIHDWDWGSDGWMHFVAYLFSGLWVGAFGEK